MKIVAISDTHGRHDQVQLPKGDILIHAGDISGRGREDEVLDFLNWFTLQDFKYKVFIAGNHDFYFEQATEAAIRAIVPANIIYLNDSGASIEGIHIWGSPVTPWFYDWAFNRHRGKAIQKHWDLIPENTDILITHGPPKGILDKIVSGDTVGCERLVDALKIIKPKFSIFGHIHEARGVLKKKHTTYINASVVNLQYQVVHSPVVFDW